jgi:hypothetical protein
MKRFSLLAGAALVALLSGCGGSIDVDETEAVATEGQQEQIGTTSQGVTYNAVNCVCAQTLELRNAPGGSRICTLRNREQVYVYYPPSGAYADVSGFSTVECMWVRGWAMKDYLSVSCC